MTYFLVRRLPDWMRDALEADAGAQEVPIQEVLRQILCAHYDLDCPAPERNSWPRRDAWEGSKTINLAMPDNLWAAVKEDAAETGESMQSLVKAALDAHYERSAV